MAANKATKAANIDANIYDGVFQLLFDCVGVTTCYYALCSFMPPDGSEECCFREHGSCRNPPAQDAAIKKLRDRLTKELKDRSEE